LKGRKRLPMAFRIDLDCCELAAGLAERPRDPDARVAGRCSDLEGLRVLVFHDEAMERAPVRGRNVHVAPRSLAALEERLDACIEISALS
jgi:hypothetical protein